jgi:hypothetical protein
MIHHAGVSPLRPIRLSDFVIAFSTSNLGLILGEGTVNLICTITLTHCVIVISLYAKSGWKRGTHQAVTDHSNISALSRVGIQVFQRIVGPQFRTIPITSSSLKTKKFELVAPIHILFVLSSKIKVTTTGVELTSMADVTLFNDLFRSSERIEQAVKLFSERGLAPAGLEEDSSSELDD